MDKFSGLKFDVPSTRGVLIFCVLTAVLSMLIVGIIGYGSYNQGREYERQEAIKAGVAHYYFNPYNGTNEFHYGVHK